VRTTNVANLDDGTCGRNLQVGSDTTASATSTPTFLLWGDGGLSKYDIFVDGVKIGTFSSDGFANVCIPTTVPISDGPHVLTGNELQPHSTYTITPFNFSVDTVPPAQPSTPVISSYSDSGVPGDHITMYRNVNFTGTSDPNVSIQLYNGVTVIGGARADSTGHWSATTSTLADGNYVVTAAAFDTAGNKSPLSMSVPLTIDGTAPTGPITSPSDGATVAGTVNVGVNAADNVGVSKVDFQVDGTTKSTDTASPWTYAWNSASVANGTHTLTAVTTDLAGSTATSTVTVNVQNGTATVPGAPTLGSPSAGNTTVALAWTPPASDGGSPINGYKIYRGTASGNETLITTVSNLATSYTDTGLINGTTYYYQVTATNLIGEGSRSAEQSATPVQPATVPGAPTLNSATAGTNSVALAWTAPSSNGGSAVTGYKVYRSTTSGTETLLTTLGNVTNWTDTGLTAGVTYYYQLTAVNSVGESGRSAEKNASPTSAATAPGAPTLSSASAGNATVSLTWNAPSSNGGSAITNYKLYRSTSTGTETLLTTLGNVTAYADSGLANGVTYYYKLSAVNAIGESALSGELNATPTQPATVPGAPTLNSATAGNNSVALAWTAPSSNGGSAVTGYKVYRSTSSGTETLLTTLGNTASYTDSGLANGVTYYYKVSAVNAIGESALSGELNATPVTTPSAPTLNSATAGTSSVALAWTAPSSTGGTAISGYKVYRSTTSGTETLLTTLGNVTNWTDTGLTAGVTYYYQLTALNSVGESGRSAEKNATPTSAATIPGAPTLSSASAGNATVSLTWNAPTSNGGSAITNYKLYRSTSTGTETLLTTLGNVSSYTDSGLANGVTYYYKLSAVNTIGESALSGETNATPVTTPTAPSLNSATAGTNSVALAWTAPSSNGGSAISGYKVYRSTSSGTETLLTTLGNVTNWTDTGLTGGVTYYYQLTAVNSVGESGRSAEKNASPTSAATIPGAPTLSSASAGNATVSLTWNAPSSNGGSAITNYKLYRSTSSGTETLLTTLGNVTSYTDSGLGNGVTYYYKVSAVNAIGESALSGELNATPTQPATAPGAPSLNSATAGNNSVALAWTAPSSNGGSAVTGYNVYRSTTSGTETLLTTLGNVTNWTDTGLTAGVTYYYQLTAVNNVGESARSTERSAVPTSADSTAPSKPSGLSAALTGTTQVALTWSASTDNVGVTGYQILRDNVVVATVANTYYVDSGLAAGSSHTYQVKAVDAAGNTSQASSSVSARLGTASGSTGTLSGVVVDSGGTELRNANVSLTLSNGTVKTARTSKSGVWSLTSLPAGTYTVTISMSGYPTRTASMTAVAGQTVIGIVSLS
jgi:fibronectin type 3 domain-containing protein